MCEAALIIKQHRWRHCTFFRDSASTFYLSFQVFLFFVLWSDQRDDVCVSLCFSNELPYVVYIQLIWKMQKATPNRGRSKQEEDEKLFCEVNKNANKKKKSDLFFIFWGSAGHTADKRLIWGNACKMKSWKIKIEGWQHLIFVCRATNLRGDVEERVTSDDWASVQWSLGLYLPVWWRYSDNTLSSSPWPEPERGREREIYKWIEKQI